MQNNIIFLSYDIWNGAWTKRWKSNMYSFTSYIIVTEKCRDCIYLITDDYQILFHPYAKIIPFIYEGFVKTPFRNIFTTCIWHLLCFISYFLIEWNRFTDVYVCRWFPGLRQWPFTVFTLYLGGETPLGW